ncbi:putative membrane protein [Campylobacter ureolyticus RIGS 9880]|uniref:Membrane protein n=1 Tax=Campylobacter ureolyticus RIGS 9880 TaxID=1032069 RepID=A0AAU8U295_9BACT|nr:hypothetical protein [Campylobacter ureolyticus]AKT91356.1 putative membrane protein [Campylobacter ureolyticus RIGS 9880]
MSDDKREKLREYLRNNRPKSKINLGNNPYENSNNELDGLNSDENLNSDNSQISSNTINKRDYDKEPLIVKNYSVLLVFIICLMGVILIAIFTIYNDQRYFYLVISIFICIESSSRLFSNKNSFYVVFNESSIQYLANNKLEKEIITKEIKHIKNCFADEAHLIKVNKKFARFIILAIISFLTYCLCVGDFFIVLVPLIIFMFTFAVKFIFEIFINKKFSFKFYTGLIIYGKDDDMIDFLPKISDYKKIKKYFLAKKCINLDSIDTKFIPLEF